jgi:DNA-binding NarL/FixJ family response regulator
MALRTFSEDPDKFDLAIVDPVMPELTGIDLAQRFRRIRNGFPVMLYSPYTDPSLHETIENAGLRHTIFRPLGLRELGKAVREAAYYTPPNKR